MQLSRIVATFTFVLVTLSSFSVHAIPAFARQEGVKCTSCHTAWPQLNAKGRAFKENGYRFPADTDQPRSLSDVLDDGVPMAAIFVARPYDKKKSGDPKNRAFHEFELFVAGALNDGWSGIAEVEAEDETSFSPVIATGVVAYHANKALNIAFSWSPYFWSDSYGMLGDGFRMTRGHVKAIDTAFGGVDGSSGLRGTRQNTSLYGRPIKQLFYSFGYSGIAKDAEGEDAKNLHARVAFDITPNIMLGGFYVDGDNSTTNRTFSRSGLDFQADMAGTRLQALFTSGTDDTTTGGEETNNALSVQGMYFGGDNPVWVPVVRYDSYEKNDGNDSYGEVTFNLTRYFAQNIKGYIEYWKQVDVPNGADKDDRLTAQLSVAF